MKNILVVLLLSCFSFAQLPDNPKQEYEPVSAYTLFHNSRPSIWNGNSRAGNILFWGGATASVIAGWYDASQTVRGLESGVCTERNIGGPGGRPSPGRVYGEIMAWDAAAIGMGYVFKRLHVPGVPYVSLGVSITKHIRGGMAWNGTGCL